MQGRGDSSRTSRSTRRIRLSRGIPMQEQSHFHAKGRFRERGRLLRPIPRLRRGATRLRVQIRRIPKSCPQPRILPKLQALRLSVRKFPHLISWRGGRVSGHPAAGTGADLRTSGRRRHSAAATTRRGSLETHFFSPKSHTGYKVQPCTQP